MRTIKIFSLVLLFCFGLIVVPRTGYAGDDPDEGTSEKKYRTGYIVPDWYREWREKAEKLKAPKGATYPTRFDWRDSNAVTPAKNQGQCGSCWAFCALGALEAHVKIYGEVEMDLSEQQILSCVTPGTGCDGDNMATAYNLFRTQGSADEACMPYHANDTDPCIQHLCDKWAKLDYYTPYVPVPNTVDDLKNAIYNYGPLAVGMAACDEFQSYGGNGECFDYECFPVNHGVLLVGWDDTLQCGDDQGAWIGKNSWGSGWGVMDGFFYIKYGCSAIGVNADLINYVFHRPYVRLEDYGVSDEAGGNGDGTPEPGETVRLDFALKNLWTPLGEVEVTVSADTEGIVIADDYSQLGDMESKEILDNSSDPMEFYVPDDFPVRRVYFTFHVEGDSGGGVTYTADTTVEIWVGRVEILLVDDDQGVDINSNYEGYYLGALDSLKAVYHVWDKKNEPDTFYNFSDYKILIWFTGDHRDSIFSDTDVESLMTFLDNGGRLFLTSQDAVEVLDGSVDLLRQQLLTDYLHVDYAGNNDKPLVEGYPEDEVGDTLWIRPWGAGANQISKDNLVPDSEADTVLVYAEINWTPTDLVAGTKFQNDYFKVVLFGFGFEALSSGTHIGHPLSDPHFVMRRVLDWLNAPGPTIEVISPNGGEIWFVDSTYCIHWQSSSSFQDSVKIELFTHAGRESLIIIDTTTNDGEYCWDPDTPSDSCLVRISDVDNNIPWDISDSFFFILNYVPGDPTGDALVNIADVVYLTTYLFAEGPPPQPMAAGDPNRDCVVNIADVVYLVTYLFLGGPPPQPGCA